MPKPFLETIKKLKSIRRQNQEGVDLMKQTGTERVADEMSYCLHFKNCWNCHSGR